MRGPARKEVILNEAQRQAEHLLGPPIRVELHRGWAIFHCPFCDAPGSNLGVNLEHGHWKCLVCDAAGPNLTALQRRLERRSSSSPAGNGESEQHPIARLNDALAEASATLPRSPAAEYLGSLGVQMPIVLTYGLGYGLPQPTVEPAAQRAAYQARLATSHGYWLWAGALVYADPPTDPLLIQARHLRREAGLVYQTWGRMLRPLGSWRLNRRTRKVVVVKDLAAMLVFAQALHERRVSDTLPVCTGGISATYDMLRWFGSNVYEYMLLPDPGDRDWARPIVNAIGRCPGSRAWVIEPPGDLRPIEALREGWWPVESQAQVETEQAPV